MMNGKVFTLLMLLAITQGNQGGSAFRFGIDVASRDKSRVGRVEQGFRWYNLCGSGTSGFVSRWISPR